jgi:hypothetical protein
MKKIFLFISFFTATMIIQAQNVGIGTNVPVKKLSVAGSLLIDQGNDNKGSLDSAALLFGHPASVGISSTKQVGANIGGIDVWTNGTKRLSINQNGNTSIGTAPNNIHKLLINGKLHSNGNISTDDSLTVLGSSGIGGAPSPGYRFRVNGHSRFEGFVYMQYTAQVEGQLNANGGAKVQGTLEGDEGRINNTLRVANYASVGGTPDSNFRLRVYDGNSRFGGSVEATGNLTIGGALDNTYRLRVIGGNSRFGGDAQVTGNMDIGGNIDLTGQLNAGSANVGALAIAGKGSVRSDGLSPLRIGFNSKAINVTLPAGAIQEFTVNITDFAGDNDDVRVMVSQFQYGVGAGPNSWERTLITVSDVNAVTDTCKINVHNTTSNQLTIVGTIYLTTIAKN